MKTNKLFHYLSLFLLLTAVSCNVEDPEPENESEVITTIKLTFTPVSTGQAIEVEATDPDGEGPDPIQVNPFTLASNTEYTLSIEFLDDINNEDITEEVKEEDGEHLLLFGWTDGLFTNPSGDGNIDNRTDPVEYLDFDANNLELGLETGWTTSASLSGDFRIVLKHQPDIKTATSGINDGESDVDVTFPITIAE